MRVSNQITMHIEYESHSTMKTSTVLIFILHATSIVHGSEVKFLPCGDDGWTPYKDEKCVKLFKNFLPRPQAQEHCRQQASISDTPSLVTIKHADEQLFLNEYVFNSSDSNSVWIGGERRPGSETEFVWADGSPVQGFTNWRVGSPSNIVGRPCVQMVTKYTRQLSHLEWVDISCTGGASWFICEKLQAWSIEQLQRAVLDTRRKLLSSIDKFTDVVTELRNLLTDLRTETTGIRNEMTATGNSLNGQLQTLQSNPVPIGFIYVQLSGQSEPRNIWPTVSWTEVTSQYAGLFFRAQGGGSEGFGSVQEAFSPRINRIETASFSGFVSESMVFPIVSNMNWVATGPSSSMLNPYFALRFWESSGEIRPRNSAIRIWRRSQ